MKFITTLTAQSREWCSCRLCRSSAWNASNTSYSHALNCLLWDIGASVLPGDFDVSFTIWVVSLVPSTPNENAIVWKIVYLICRALLCLAQNTCHHSSLVVLRQRRLSRYCAMLELSVMQISKSGMKFNQMPRNTCTLQIGCSHERLVAAGKLHMENVHIQSPGH